MFNEQAISALVSFIQQRNGIGNKKLLECQVTQAFGLEKQRSVLLGDGFAIRFSSSKSTSFSNTVLSLSKLLQYDNIPVIICLVSPSINYMKLANTSFLKKISHSSQDLREDNIRGSFNGSDIMESFNGVLNTPENFRQLFEMHRRIETKDNIVRLVAATSGIVPTGDLFMPTQIEVDFIYNSIRRAEDFLQSEDYHKIAKKLDERVSYISRELIFASKIDNVNIRGRIMESLITAPQSELPRLIDNLYSGHYDFFTADDLGDDSFETENFEVAVDIKTKMLALHSNPKGYNVDKVLSFLSNPKTVYLIYIVAVGEDETIYTRLCSMYNTQILGGTRIIEHWAGRNSRGVTQYNGTCLEDALFDYDVSIDSYDARVFLNDCLNR